MYDIAIIKDGIIFPTRTGASYKIYNIAKEYQDNGLKVLFVLVDRGWVSDADLKRSKLSNILLASPKSVYSTDKLTAVLRKSKIPIIQTNIPELIIKKKNEWKDFCIVYDSHDYLSEQSTQKKLSEEHIAYENFIDLTACSIADLTFCCSERDRIKYLEEGISSKKIKVMKNGCLVPKDIRLTSRKKEIIFLGHLYYEPNLVALREIYNLARMMPSFSFVCIGMYPKKVEIRKPLNVSFEGYVKNISRRLQKSLVGLAPLRLGSGSRVKILDYLANGLYVISSEVGASGLEDLRENIIICNDLNRYPMIIEDFVKKRTPNLKGYNAVKNYSFSNIGKEASSAIYQLLSKKYKPKLSRR